jgi:predicted AlkP superfamily phosphohydrolase/phosphomutase
MGRSGRRRAVVVGLDGVPAAYLAERVAAGTMPNLAALLGEGRMVTMDSSVPPVSGVAWASLTTGVNPGRHGIFGFTELRPGTYDLRFPNATSLLVPRVWERLADSGRRSVVLNVPGTYPARAPAGSLLVSGFVSPRLDRSVAPAAEWLPVAEQLGYRTDVEAALDWDDPAAVAAELTSLTEVRRQLWWRAWEALDWDLFWGVFTETDRLHHFHWGRRDEGWVDDILDVLYRALDDHLAEVAERMGPNDLLVVVSDHGFAPIRAEVHLNHALAGAGLLHFETDQPQSLDDLGPGTRAFVLDPGRVYVHRKGRYPLGSVAPAEERAVVDDVVEALSALRDPDSGEPACGALLRARQAFSGPALADAPDLTVLPRPGFDPKGAVAGGRAFTRGPLTGMHSFEGAVCYVRGEGPERVTLEDVAVSVLAHLGGDHSGLDGKPLLGPPG